MRAHFRAAAATASGAMCLGMLIIIATRCRDDAPTCANSELSTLSWLLDDDWRATFAAVLIGMCALVHVALLWLVWTPRELLVPRVRQIRAAWTLGYASAVGVAVFTVREHEVVHKVCAGGVFVSMVGGALLVLLWQRGKHRWQGAQAAHFALIVALISAYVWTRNGWYEVACIFLICVYFNWLSLGIHWTEDVVLGVSVSAMASHYVARARAVPGCEAAERG